MVQGFGLISAMVLYKRNPKSTTKLDRLIQSQKQRPSKQVTVHQFPIKAIFSILILVFFMACLQHFKNQFKSQMELKIANLTNLTAKSQTGQRISLEQFAQPIQNEQFYAKNTKTSSSKSQQSSKLEQDIYQTVKVVNAIHLIGLFTILALVGSTELKCISAVKQKKQIIIKIYYIFGLKDSMVVPIGDACRLQIYQSGQSKFTFNDYHYEIRLINPNWEQENKEVYKVICHKSSRFQARKAIILLSSVLGLQINLKIHKLHQNLSNLSKSKKKKRKQSLSQKKQ